MEDFYFLFEDLEHWSTWDDQGYALGFIILLISTFLFLSLYYLILGRLSMRFSSMGGWLLFGFFNSLLIFGLSLSLLGYKTFDLAYLGDFFFKIYQFALINALYGFVFYLLFSVGFKRFSIYSKFYPVKF